MESQPLNPEFRNNPENFHTCISEHAIFIYSAVHGFKQGYRLTILT